jgi:signal peptide peptidase SppA
MPAGAWAIDHPHLDRHVLQVASAPRVNLADMARLQDERRASREATSYHVADGIALIDVSGVILPRVPLIYEILEIPAISTEQLRIDLNAAAHDPAVSAVIMTVSSPGGSVAGVEQAARAALRLRDRKPLVAYVDDLAASAGYWLAAQANAVVANRTAKVGSIGVFTVIDDYSRYFENLGISSHIIASSPLKTFGDEYSERLQRRQTADTRRGVDGILQAFAESVAAGRRVSEQTARQWATGEIWLAPEAMDLGLIDRIADFEDVYDAAVAAANE